MNPAARSAFAVLTPLGRGGIAVLRCVGPAASGAIEACFRPAGKGVRSLDDAGLLTPSCAPCGTLAYGHIVDAGGQPLDEVILCRAASETFEVNCHGGPAAVRAVSQRLAALGLEEVKADTLLEIEGVPRLERDARRALRAARTALAARALLDQLHGALAAALDTIASQLEAAAGAEALAGLDLLLGRWRSCGRLLADPPRIAIAGRPNAGKSTLINRLVGTDRVITSEVPGTTRDYVEAEASLEGVPVVLVDTAGLRETADGVERASVERARCQAARAEVVVYLVDAAAGRQPEDLAALEAMGPKVLAAWNKVDLAGAPTGALAISALRGDGSAALVAAILERLGWHAPAPGEAVPFTREQAEALESARQATSRGRHDEALAALRPLLILGPR